MAGAKTTEKNGESRLILYRLDRVEAAVKDVGTKVDAQENIKKADLIEFRDTVVGRINEIRDSLQKQIDDKADRTELQDIKTLIKAVASVFGSIIAGLIIYYITHVK